MGKTEIMGIREREREARLRSGGWKRVKMRGKRGRRDHTNRNSPKG